ncbi:SDR family oxidoreductase [Arthrobacter pigmenti]
MGDQYTFQDPAKRYPSISPPEQRQQEPGLDRVLEPYADHGENTYRGTNRLEGRKALITGADSGIGAAVAVAYAREGADVALSYHPDEEADAKHIVSVIEETGKKAVPIPGDIMDRQHCTELVATAVDQLGGLDILVNNAGKQIVAQRLEDLSDEQFDQTFKTNVYAMFWITKEALPHLPAGSSIINTTSIEAYQPPPIRIDYATTKASINVFSKGLAQQLAPRGIRVNTVAPGPVWTPIQPTDGQPQEELPGFGQSTPLGRAGQPTEMAPAFVFLASPESSYVIGETLNANGGMPTP